MKQCESRLGLFFLSVLMVLTFSAPISAERPPFKVYTTADGLAHDNVNKIVRDSRGFLWICTAEGLSRFDGSRFKNYTQDQGLPHRNVNDFLETRDGTYLVATSAGLAVFDPNGKPYRWNVLESKLEQNEVASSNAPPLFRTFIPQTDNRLRKTILSLAQDRQGTIWAGTMSGLFRVARVGAGEWQFQEYEIDEWRGKSVSYPALRADSQGNLLVGSGFAFYRISPRGSLEKIDNHGAASILVDRDGRVWVDSAGNFIGLRVFESENGSLKLSKTYTKKDGLPADAFYFALMQMSDGRIFVGMDNGLCEFLPDVQGNNPKFRVLDSEKVTSLAEDTGGNLWLGTELRGAWKLARSGFTSFGEQDGISTSDGLGAIFTSKNGEVFIPTNPRKILHLVDGKFESVEPAKMPSRSWGWHFLDLLSQDGEWWMPTREGLLRYPKVAQFADLGRTPPRKIYTKADGLFSNEVFNIFEDSHGDIWITVINGGENSLLRWERKTDKIVSYTNTSDGLPTNNGPIAFASDSDGDVWLGFYFGGLARYRNSRFQLFTAKDGIPESTVDDILSDSRGRLWIATTGRGLFRVDNPTADKPAFNSISTSAGLSSNQVLCLTEDRFGRIYSGTGRGINRIDTNGNLKLFTQADGLPSNYVTRCATDKNGALWFVTRNTLVRFVPETEQTATPLPVFIDKISVNGVPHKISELGETEISPFELASDQRQIQVDYFALTFSAGENVRYQYRLDEQAWSTPTQQQTLNLDLSPGKHSFLLRAVRTDGVASEKPARISFRILRPIWQRWWFIMLLLCACAAAIYALYRYRLAQLLKVERVRTRIATDLHDDIGASLSRMAILSEVVKAQNGVGDEQSTEMLTDIANSARGLVDSMSDIVWSIDPRRDNLQSVVQRLRQFAADVLESGGVNWELQAAPDLERIELSPEQRQHLYLIFKEGINNIARYAQCSSARLSLELNNGNLIGEISDDGRGFELLAIDQRREQSSGGNGLRNMQARAKELGGDLEITSTPGKGTKLRLTVPVK